MLNPDRDVLVAIDVQNDFCPGGALAVTDGDAVIAPINALGEKFSHLVVTQDWHPAGHLSFASSHPGKEPFSQTELAYGAQTLWPDHCVRGTDGAAFHKDLVLDGVELVIRKGFRGEIDSYSAFFENDRKTPTGLAGYLKERGLQRVFLAGLATDFCVAFSAVDAAALGFETFLIEDACRAIDLDGSLDAARKAMAEAGVRTVSSHAL
ncbi:bifunctional nicotinamidase/pyrazinamidase [Labrenzia sp. 011]|uniref:bifunctional nicotinamidase/pyrazinamidase n=1 Tax=Labrenzia sp. 011 TaxID=2171494 RepID=UPI000D51FBD0|nr:bifunctional nicotinamidase/pyrazinamidase [Labrenzia sp. 011]PVB60138.1 bifunctional nicotinamidase/pyrazinamidase [Labrenzia sp. 011]